MLNTLEINCLKGSAIQTYIHDLATMRIKVFKEYPYLYDGDIASELQYLKSFQACNDSVMVLASDEKKVVGFSTGMPLAQTDTAWQIPFLTSSINPEDIFYLGESILLSEYRGRKIYKHFFWERENVARQMDFSYTAFCAIERPIDDPKRPPNYFSFDKIWHAYGYKKYPALLVNYEWVEIGDNAVSKKTLAFYLKKL